MKRICIISDLHGNLPNIEECDILCICGDIVPNNIQYDLNESIYFLRHNFKDWIDTLNINHIILIWGDHDFIGEYLYNSMYDQSKYLFGENSNIHILNDKSLEIYGIKFYGTSWCPDLKELAFYGTSSFLKTVFNKIPKDTDILLTHYPAKFGHQGIVLDHNKNFLKNFGCEELKTAIDNIFGNKKKKTYIFSGHIHSGNHYYEIENNCIYRNVSLLDKEYNCEYHPLYIDYKIPIYRKIKKFLKKLKF